MTTRKQIQEYMTATRLAFREIDRALAQGSLDHAGQIATDAAGYAGEVENLVWQYAFERGPNRRSSGDTQH